MCVWRKWKCVRMCACVFVRVRVCVCGGGCMCVYSIPTIHTRFARVNQVTPASLRYPLSVFNKNSTLNSGKSLLRGQALRGQRAAVTRLKP